MSFAETPFQLVELGWCEARPMSLLLRRFVIALPDRRRASCNAQGPSGNTNEVISWLKNRVPSTCVILHRNFNDPLVETMRYYYINNNNSNIILLLLQRIYPWRFEKQLAKVSNVPSSVAVTVGARQEN